MDGEFVCEATTGLTKEAVGGGNLLIMGASCRNALDAAEAAVRRWTRCGRDHAVPRRHRSLGLEGRLEIQGAAGLDQ